MLVGCYGGFEGTPGQATDSSGVSAGDVDVPTPLECEEQPDLVGLSQLRRLNREQYVNTVRDLLGFETERVEGFVPDDRVGPFATNSTTPITQLAIEKFQDAAEDLAAQAAADLDPLLPCNPSEGETECAREFIETWGLRAYRRPLTEGEMSDLMMLYQLGRQDGSFGAGIALVIEAMLQSPNFLYLFEFTEGELGDYELASRLSYLVWNTMPDAELFDAAAAGELTDEEQLEAHARRMLEDPRASATLASFHTQWMGLYELELTDKDPELFDGFGHEQREAMRQEMADFVEYVFTHDDGTLQTLLTAPYGFPQGDLLDIYGIGSAEIDDDGRAVFPEGERYGLLTLPAVMAVHAHRDRTSPVHRGILIREQLLCQDLPPPPAEVNDVLPDPDPDKTEQDLLREHKDNPDCSGCHNLIDPIGFTFENYDGVGRFRTRAGNVDVDVSGELLGSDIDGPLEGVGDLAESLLRSGQVQQCVADQWFRYGLGRDPDPVEDACARASLKAALEASGGDLEEMLVYLIKSPSFRQRSAQ